MNYFKLRFFCLGFAKPAVSSSSFTKDPNNVPWGRK